MWEIFKKIIDFLPKDFFVRYYKNFYQAKGFFIVCWMLMSTISFVGLIKLNFEFKEYKINSHYNQTFQDSKIDQEMINSLLQCDFGSYIFRFEIGNTNKYNFLNSLVEKFSGKTHSLIVSSAYGCVQNETDCIIDVKRKNMLYDEYNIDIVSRTFIESNNTIFGKFNEDNILSINLRNKDGSLTAAGIFVQQEMSQFWDWINRDFKYKNHDIHRIFLYKIKNPISYAIKEMLILSFDKDAQINCNSKNYKDSPEQLLKKIGNIIKQY